MCFLGDLDENLMKKKEQDSAFFLFTYTRESGFTSVYLGLLKLYIYLQVGLAKFVVVVVCFHSLLRS